MDRRSWPWKKKSSEKTMSAPDSAVASLASATSQGNQDNPMKVNYVQISVESYEHLTDLENQVKTLNDQADMLNEKLSAAQSEITTKENLVKQHIKVAEDAVSGWEKADAEALELKNQLESVTLLKLTAEDRASHLDGALKECMKQVRNLKEEHEVKLQQTVLTKTKQWEKIKHELEAKIIDLDQEILRSSAENATLSRSLHERSDMLMKISEEKSQAEVEIELLRSDIQSCEKEINSYKYELHVISKELEIRNEEKNMSVRSAEVANKQHLEGVKKIAKLESECQRLRGLVRKKLPGPAALAQMKIEVESLGRDYGETRIRRSPVKNSDSHLTPISDFSLDTQQCHKENEFLSARLLASEEETKMLKEALAKRNCELQASRTLSAKTASKLRNFETQMQVLNQNRSPEKLNIEISTKGYSSPNLSNPPSLTSISVDEVDEESRYGESWATALISELSHFNKEKSAGKTNKVDNSNHQEVMDDFLEMERLACSPTESHGAISLPDNSTDRRNENEDHNTLCDTSAKLISSNGDLSVAKHESDVNQVSLSKLRSRISMIFDSDANDADMVKILEEIKHVLQDALPQSSPSYDSKERADAASNKQDFLTDTGENVDSEISLTQDTNPTSDSKVNIEQELATAVSQIHDFVLSLAKEAMAIQNGSPQGHAFRQRIEQFSDSVSKVLCSKMSALDLLLDLSHVLVKAGELSINLLGYNSCERETDSSDCIDKVTLLENKVAQDDPLIERFSSDCTHISRSTSGLEVLQEGSSCSDSELKAALCKCTMELEELKSEKNKTATDLAICTENLERTELQLQDTNLLLAELRSQLESSQKSNSLAETQLKCMVESYRTLETRAQELEAEVDLLRTKVENIDNELQEEKQNHQDALVRCKDLQEKIESHESCSVCSLSSAADVDAKFKQEREIAAATEKLAECQETIFLLGRQLKTFHPSADHAAESPYSSNNKDQTNDDDFIMEEGPRRSSFSPLGMNGIQDPNHTEMEESIASSNVFLAKEGRESSPSDVFDSSLASPSDSDAKLILRSPISSKHPPKDSPTKPSSSSTTPEKHPRSFSRFFSSKSKNGHKVSVQNYE